MAERAGISTTWRRRAAAAAAGAVLVAVGGPLAAPAAATDDPWPSPGHGCEITGYLHDDGVVTDPIHHEVEPLVQPADDPYNQYANPVHTVSCQVAIGEDLVSSLILTPGNLEQLVTCAPYLVLGPLLGAPCPIPP